MATNHPPRCPACGLHAPLIWVHGHGQCAHCAYIVEPCCEGVPPEDEFMAEPQTAEPTAELLQH